RHDARRGAGGGRAVRAAVPGRWNARRDGHPRARPEFGRLGAGVAAGASRLAGRRRRDARRRHGVRAGAGPLGRVRGDADPPASVTPRRSRASGRASGLAHGRGLCRVRRPTRFQNSEGRETAMSTRIAINGFGRIGRLVFRALHEQGLFGKDIEVVAVGDIVPADNLAYLLKYDSVQRKFDGQVSSKKSGSDKEADDVLTVDGKDVLVVSAKTPAELPWKKLGVDYVIESTGLFTDGEKAKGHLAAGAKKVIISAPAKGEDITLVT